MIQLMRTMNSKHNSYKDAVNEQWRLIPSISLNTNDASIFDEKNSVSKCYGLSWFNGELELGEVNEVKARAGGEGEETTGNGEKLER